MSDTTKIVSLMTRPGVGMVKGHVTGKDDRNWRLFHSLRSFSIECLRTDPHDQSEVLVTLPKAAYIDIEIGSEVWVMGKSLGPLRFHADMIFLPQFQQGVNLTEGNGLPHWSYSIVTLVALTLLIGNLMWVIYYLGIPTIIALLAYSVISRRPNLCSYEAWEAVEQRANKPEKELPQVKSERGIPRSLIGLYAFCGWLLLPLTWTEYITPYFWMEPGIGLVLNVTILMLVTFAAIDLTAKAVNRGGAG